VSGPREGCWRLPPVACILLTDQIARTAVDLPVVRTRDEAHLYFDLHPCPECGSVDLTWEHAAVSVDGEPASEYYDTCPGCDTEREFVFALPKREFVSAEFPNFGGPEPS